MSIVNSIKDQTLPLLKPPYVVYFAACCFLQFGTFWVAGGLNLFLPEILNKLALTRDETEGNYGVCDVYKYPKHGSEESNESNEEVQENNFLFLLSFSNIKLNFLQKDCDDSISDGVFLDITYLGTVYIIGYVVLSLILRPNRRRVILGEETLIFCIFHSFYKCIKLFQPQLSLSQAYQDLF